MTCYFRHLNEFFDQAGITVTKENREDINRAIHKIVGVEYKNCPAAWKEVKKRLAKNAKGFATALRNEIK